MFMQQNIIHEEESHLDIVSFYIKGTFPSCGDIFSCTLLFSNVCASSILESHVQDVSTNQ